MSEQGSLDGGKRGEAIDEELSFHLDAATNDGLHRGLSEDAARAEAVRDFGDYSAHRDACRRIAYGNEAMKKKVIGACAGFMVLVLAYAAGLVTPAVWNEFDPEPDWARMGAFAGLEWYGQTPVVLVADEWFVLESIHGRSVEEIMNHCREEYGSQAQKRFSEDLYEVMCGMGLPPTLLDVTLIPTANSSHGGGLVLTTRLVMTKELRRSAKQRLWEDQKGMPRPPASI